MRLSRRFQRMRAFSRDTCGQGMTEYILITGLIAIGSVVAIWQFGDNIYKLWDWATGAIVEPSQNAGSADLQETQSKNEW